MRVRRRYRVSGRVQGVWFRATTRDKGEELGLQGFVRNLPDGRVEAVAEGDEAAIREFEAWLWTGPPLARVSEVEVLPVSDTVLLGPFGVRYSGHG